MSGKSKTIQEKMNELAKQVAWFDSDEFSLEAAIEHFKQAEKLAAEIETELANLKNDITVLKQRFDGEE
jgi:exodeoxyribonuclease VII small subunit